MNSEKLIQLAAIGRALVIDGRIINVNGAFVRAIEDAVLADDDYIPRLPEVEDIDDGVHPEIETWIAIAPLDEVVGLHDVASPEYALPYHGIIADKRVKLTVLHNRLAGFQEMTFNEVGKEIGRWPMCRLLARH